MDIDRYWELMQETNLHAIRVSKLAVEFGRYVGLSQSKCEVLAIAGVLHDLGKLVIDIQVLGKPGKLDAIEMTQMRKHVLFSTSALRAWHLPDDVVQTVLEHHENFDGSGYPNNKQGDDISLCGQILHIVDIYDALKEDRCYRKALPIPVLLKTMDKMGRNGAFDIGLYVKFLHMQLMKGEFDYVETIK